MAKFKQFIEKIATKKNIKILLMFFLILWGFIWLSFADESVVTTDTESIKWSLVKVFYYIFSVLSWVWIVLANLAWKLMTNDFVYGTFLHLDSTLWTFWNMMKNIANFTLWVLVLVSIVKSLFSMKWLWTFSDKWIDSPLAVIKNTVVAWVFIQMSWFLVAVVIDISSICVAAIWALPSQLISSNNELMSSFRSNLNTVVGDTVIIDYKNETQPITVNHSENQNLTDEDIMSLFDTLLPTSDSLSGPLIYIWLSVFKFRDYNVQSVTESTPWSSLLLSVWFDGLILLFYTILMMLLFLFNLFRIIILWLVIPMIPLIILLNVFKLKLFDKSELLKQISSIWNLIKLIFKPVIMVGALSLILIVILLIRWIISADATNLDIEDSSLNIKSNCTSENVCNSTMNVWNFINVTINGAKDSFADIIIYILWLCLMCFLVMVSKMKTWIAFVDKPMESIFDKVKTFATEVPIVPVPWWNRISLDKLWDVVNREDLLTRRLWIDPVDNDDIINQDLLGIGKSIDRLTPNLFRETFITEARSLNKEYNFTNNDKNCKLLYGKIEEWNKKNKNSRSILYEEIFPEKEKKDEEKVRNPNDSDNK